MSVNTTREFRSESALSYPGWRVVLAAHFGVMVSFGSLLVFTFGVFLKPLGQEFGWSREAISRAFGIAALTVAVCSPLLGRWLDRYGPRRIILPCMAIFGLSFASLALLTPHLWHLYLVFVLLGMVGNGTTQMGYSRAVATWFEKRRGMAFSFIMAGVGVGSIVFPALAQSIISGAGWRWAYAVLGAIVLLLGIPLTAIYVRERSTQRTPIERDPTESGTEDGADLRTGLRSRIFWILVAVLFLSSVAINGAITHLAALLSDRGITPGEAAAAASALGASSFCARLVTGWLLDRFFGPRVAFFLFLFTGAGILLLSQANSLFTGVVAAMLIGVGLGGEADLTPYLLTRYFGLRAFSTLYGFTWSFYAVAGAIGPVLLGHVYDATGSYTNLLIALSGTVCVAGLLMLLLPRFKPSHIHSDL